MFEPHEEFCWASYRLAGHRKAKSEELGESQRASWQLSTRFRKGHEPDIAAGLNINEDGDVGG